LPPAETPSPRRRRSLFWPGFAFGFLILAAVSCGILGAGLGFNRLTLAEIQGNGPAWTPLPITPTAPVAEAAAVTGVSTRFVAGQAARNLTNSRVNIRQTPGYLGKPASDVVGMLTPGETLEILGDSTLADKLTWWRIRATTTSGPVVEGWVAEASASGVQILGELR